MPEDVYKKLYSIVEEKNRDKQLPVVLTAHLAMTNSDWCGHDFATDTNIGGLNCQDAEIFGNSYDYVALGHIHRQQDINEEGRICYAGTPIAVSFDEVTNGHGVLLVECDKHGEKPTIKPLNIKNKNPLVNIPSTGTADWDEAKKLLEEYPDDIPAFIRLNIEVETYLPAGANDEAQLIVKNKACRVSFINSTRKTNNTQKVATSFTTSEFKKLDIIDVAKMWIESKGEDFSDEMQEMLNEVKSRLSNNNE